VIPKKIEEHPQHDRELGNEVDGASPGHWHLAREGSCGSLHFLIEVKCHF
jgi:hypothetical protein